MENTTEGTFYIIVIVKPQSHWQQPALETAEFGFLLWCLTWFFSLRGWHFCTLLLLWKLRSGLDGDAFWIHHLLWVWIRKWAYSPPLVFIIIKEQCPLKVTANPRSSLWSSVSTQPFSLTASGLQNWLMIFPPPLLDLRAHPLTEVPRAVKWPTGSE